jgi:hypothetical protein
MKEQQFDNLFNSVFKPNEEIKFSSKDELLEQKRKLMDDYFEKKISYTEFENKIRQLK